MTDGTQDSRFERDLRSILAEAEPADAPASLYAAVAAVPPSRPWRRWGSPALRAAGILAAAAVVVVAVATLVTALQPRGDRPAVGTQSTPLPAAASGLRLEYRVLPSGGKAATKEDVSALIDILQARIQATGVGTFSIAAGDTITIDLAVDPADVGTVTELSQLLSTTGRVDFVPLGQTPAAPGDAIDLATHPAIFSGDSIASATIGLDQNGARTIDVALDADATARFAAHTAQHIGEFFAITLDGQVLAAPLILEAIPNGQLQVTSGGPEGFLVAEAQRIVTILRTGPLPFPVEQVSQGLAEPTPRPASLDAGLTSEQGVACAADSSSPLTEVGSVGSDRRGAVLLWGESPDPSLIYVTGCLWQRTATGVMATDSTGGTTTALRPAGIRVDRSVGSGSAPWHHLLAGRIGDGVTAVRVRLADGSAVDAVVVDEWWLAWWEADTAPAMAQALDASGAMVAEARPIEGTEALPQ